MAHAVIIAEPVRCCTWALTARRHANGHAHAQREGGRAVDDAQLSFVVTDPFLREHPIVYASPGFARLTGYAPADVEGRNCNFLQGPGTDPRAVAVIREAIAAEKVRRQRLTRVEGCA